MCILLLLIRINATSHQANLITHLFETPHGPPQPFGQVGLGAEAFDQVDGRIELVSGLIAEFGGRMRDRKEDDSQRLNKEIVVTNLLRSVKIRDLVDARNGGDCVFGNIDNCLSIIAILHDAGS